MTNGNPSCIQLVGEVSNGYKSYETKFAILRKRWELREKIVANFHKFSPKEKFAIYREKDGKQTVQRSTKKYLNSTVSRDF